MTHFVNDYEGPPGSSSAFYMVSDGCWEDIEAAHSGNVESVHNEDPQDDGSPLTAREFKRLKKGIWCDITVSLDGSRDVTMSFKEYEGPSGNHATDKFPVLMRRDYPRSLLESSSSTDSRFTFGVAKVWLNDCIQTHADCRYRIFDTASLPTRVLDVELGQNSAMIRLQDTVNIGTSYQYLALSHCWGNVQTTTLLTSASMQRYYTVIHLHELPKTFRRAVSITRELGYRYLWIDSLCIIQDSEEDWKRESVRMGDIYRNSTCCIAAVASDDDDGGCFFSRNPLAYFPCRLGYSDGNEIIVIVKPAPEEYDYSNESLDLSDKPLWSRAWVLQEMALAPRTLI